MSVPSCLLTVDGTFPQSTQIFEGVRKEFQRDDSIVERKRGGGRRRKERKRFPGPLSPRKARRRRRFVSQPDRGMSAWGAVAAVSARSSVSPVCTPGRTDCIHSCKHFRTP